MTSGSGDSVTSRNVVEETIAIEGETQHIQAYVFRPPVGFPVAFSTIVPADMEVGYETSGRGDVVRFIAVFGGIRRPDAALSFVALPAGADSTEAKLLFDARVAEVGGREADLRPGDWAIERARPGNGSSGFLALGRQEAVWFYFEAGYPPEFSDGMGPRIDLVLRRWVWAGTGRPLHGDEMGAEWGRSDGRAD